MIVPIGHDRSIRRWPWVTIGIIAICTLVQIYTTAAAPSMAALQRAYKAGDARHLMALLEQLPKWRWGYHTGSGYNVNLVTCAFVHSGWLHLIGNMLFLWIAGSAVEDRFGRVKYALFYLGGAAAATLVFDALYEGSPTICVGASGAISAVMGAFLVYFATTQINFWYWLWYASGTFRLVAYVALPLWLGEQFLYRYLDHAAGFASVAYEAHIGGFGFGFAIAGAARLLFRDAKTDQEYALATGAAPPKPDERFERCMVAIRARDVDAVRMLASRVILDLARNGDHSRVIEVYLAMHVLPKRPITDGAYAAAARACDALGNLRLREDVVAELKAQHPGSARSRDM